MEKIPTTTLVVAGALRGKSTRWLMHRRPEKKHHGGLWEFPGGKVEPGEHPENALIRELSEELGITFGIDEVQPATFAFEMCNGGESPIVILLYRVLAWTGEPEALEGGALGWFTAQEIMELPKPPLDVELAGRLFEKVAG